MRAKRWNERVRLIATFINVTSIGLFSLAVVAPLFKDAPLGRDTRGEPIPVDFLDTFDLIDWPAMGVALALHVIALIFIGLLTDED